jgi:hypothetical protein
MEKDVSFYPMNIGRLGTFAVVLEAQAITHLVEQLGSLGGCGGWKRGSTHLVNKPGLKYNNINLLLYSTMLLDMSNKILSRQMVPNSR